MKKDTDEDYIAEDEGSASDSKKKNKGKKGAVIVNKKEMIEKCLKGFLPQGVTLSKIQNITQQQYNNLLSLKDALEFTLNYQTFIAKIVKVTDGDTVKAVIYLNGTPTKYTFRMNGIDTPEVRKGEAKQFGKKVKQILSEMIEGKIVKLQAGSFDKYGRVLARIYAFSNGKQLCINDFLIEQQFARIYTGKTKGEFTSEDEQQFFKELKTRIIPKTTNYPFQLLN